MAEVHQVSLENIARKAKVTRNTVSVALRDKPGVSAETRDRIKRIAEQWVIAQTRWSQH